MKEVVLLYEVAVGQNKLHSVHKSEESAWIEKDMRSISNIIEIFFH